MLYPRQYGLSPNHRLRLELTTQNPPQVCTQSVLGEDACYFTDPQLQSLPGGTYSILYSPAWPSLVNVPQLPWYYFSTAASAATPTSNGVIEPQNWGS